LELGIRKPPVVSVVLVEDLLSHIRGKDTFRSGDADRRLKQHRPHEGEYAGGGRDADGQGQNCRDRESAILLKMPESVPDILPACIEEKIASRIANALFNLNHAAELGAALAFGFFGGDSLANLVLHHQCEMGVKFFVDFLFDLLTLHHPQEDSPTALDE